MMETGGNPSGQCPAGVKGHCSMTEYPTYPGFKLELVEDFDQPIDLDNDPIWTYGDGALDEGQVRMAKAGVTFENGRMKLTASRMQMPGGQSFSEDKTVATQPLRSGEFRSKYNNFRYGRYEVRLKPPTSNGNFISTMFIFRTPKVVFWREVDIELTASSTSLVGTNVVFGDDKRTYDATANSYMEPSGGANFNNQTDFHTYAFEWLPNKITWYVDGREVRSHAGPNPPLPEKSAKIMMNLWIFNATYAFGGRNGAQNQYPLVAEYDWFRFYKADMENKYPCWDTPNCLDMADRIRSKNNPTDGVMDIR
ncbi:MAG TPA: family 16 glycosylhydrolase [Polyangia bacterium]